MSDDELRYVPCACGARIGVPYSAWQGRVDGHARGVADHLPECLYADDVRLATEDCRFCNALRACEQRVRADLAVSVLDGTARLEGRRLVFLDEALAEAEQRGMMNSHRGRTMYAAGLAAAREAVAKQQLHPDDQDDTWSSLTHVVVIQTALAAIDGLRGERA